MGERKATIGCATCKRTIFDLEVMDLTGAPVFIMKNCRDRSSDDVFEVLDAARELLAEHHRGLEAREKKGEHWELSICMCRTAQTHRGIAVDGQAHAFRRWMTQKAVLHGYPELLHTMLIDMRGDQELSAVSEKQMEEAGWVKKNKIYRNRRLNRDATPPPVVPEAADLEGI